jgi:hypothetical protein
MMIADLGPYHVDYNANGVFMLLGGRKGHLAMMDWKKSRLMMEFQVIICEALFICFLLVCLSLTRDYACN